MNKKVITLILAAAIFGVIIFYSILHSPISEVKRLTRPLVESTVSNIEHKDSAQHSSRIPSTSSTSIKEPAPNQSQDVEKQNHDQTARAQFLEQIEPILQIRLLNEGFTQHEVDQTAKELAIEFGKNEDVIKYSEATYRAAKTLNFSEEKKDRLNIAVLKSIAQSVDIPFDRWNQCLNYRVRSMSPCVQEIAQELSSSVAAETSGQSLLGEQRSVSVELGPQNLVGTRNGYIAQDFARALDEIVYESKTAA
ncbi:MAG: hypothetical protein M3Q07_01850 [Pseudobdellovibrionaceae bacterium]|nr:hypothetical protein [Pseudobdellovibrionaceae bacterium]